MSKYPGGLKSEATLLNLLNDLGSLSNAMLSESMWGENPWVPGDASSEKIGDVYMSLLYLSSLANVDLDEALKHSMKKHEKYFDNCPSK